MVVDDAASFRSAARQLLERRGYDVVGDASSGAEALDAAARLLPDAVLLDVHLPDADGFEVARQLVCAHRGIAVLLVSAEHMESRVEEDGQAVPFVRKSELAAIDLASFWRAAAVSGVR